MSDFYMPVDDIISDYGVPIKVYVLPQAHREAGVWVKPKLSDIKPVELNEPVFPMSSGSAILAQIVNGGSRIDGDLVWLSIHDFPVNRTILEPTTQDGRYRVTGKSNYSGYSDLIVYDLKGDDQTPNGY